jgi:hypothetical protein
MFCRKGRTRRRVSFSLPCVHHSGGFQRLPIDAMIALVDAFGLLDAGPALGDASVYLLLQQYFAELFSRQLPDDSLHLQIEERSQNFRRVQPGAFHNVINVHRLLGI